VLVMACIHIYDIYRHACNEEGHACIGWRNSVPQWRHVLHLELQIRAREWVLDECSEHYAEIIEVSNDRQRVPKFDVNSTRACQRSCQCGVRGARCEDL
jgi:hypothetical protein